jgi:Mg2+ and Co2+ transporter CorA
VHRKKSSSLHLGLDSDTEMRLVRWVHVDATDGVDELTLFRLAVKYYLHPLAIEGLLKRVDTKMEVYSDNYVVSLNILMLPKSMHTDQYAEDTEHGIVTQPPRVRIHRSHATLFLAAKNAVSGFDTMVTIHEDRPNKTAWLKAWKGEGDEGALEVERGVWEKLWESLASEPAQRVREARADWLLYEILYQIVRELKPITTAYARRLGYFRQHDLNHFNRDWLHELGEVVIELGDFARKVRPLKRVVLKMTEDQQFHHSVRQHLGDVQDAIDYVLEDTQQLSHMCNLLEEAHGRFSDKQANSTLFLLSILTACFMPLQFVTGIYGMNFKDIPEYDWEGGYVYFWCLELFLLAMSTGLFISWHGRKQVRSRAKITWNSIKKLLHCLCSEYLSRILDVCTNMWFPATGHDYAQMEPLNSPRDHEREVSVGIRNFEMVGARPSDPYCEMAGSRPNSRQTSVNDPN